MQKVTLEMPVIERCSVSKCVFNQDESCNARAITVGDGHSPLCDTYFTASRHAKRNPASGVGACKVVDCRFNQDYECLADNIIVGPLNELPKCRTCEIL